MLKKVLITATLIILILALAIFLIHNLKGFLFHTMPWLMAVAAVMGITSGIFRGLRHNSCVRKVNYQPNRHTIDSFLEHWGTAVGIFILIISGFFIKAGYVRVFSMNLHFLGLMITLYFGTYFLAHFIVSKKYNYLLPGIMDILDGTIKKYMLRATWKDPGKYLSSQKSAFLAFSILGIGILLTGAVKLAAYYFNVPVQLTQLATQTHDYLARLFVLMLLIHILFVVLVRSHRRLLPSLFTGKVK